MTIEVAPNEVVSNTSPLQYLHELEDLRLSLALVARVTVSPLAPAIRDAALRLAGEAI